MPSTYEQITQQLARLSLVMEPPQAKAIGGQPNPKYGAVVGVYVECLQPFQPWELEAGVKLALENHRYSKWPKPAELREWCIRAQKDMRPPPEPHKALQRQEDKPRQSQEDRERIGFQLQVLAEYQAAGNWGTLAQCKAEALRRLAARDSRQSQPA